MGDISDAKKYEYIKWFPNVYIHVPEIIIWHIHIQHLFMSKQQKVKPLLC